MALNNRQMEWVYTVSVRVLVDNVEVGKVRFVSKESYDDCYRQIEKHTKQYKVDDAQVTIDIISAHEKQYVVYEHSLG